MERSTDADWLSHVVGLVERAPPRVIGLAGSVAVGKSTMAADLASHLEAATGVQTDVVTTDSFLLPAAVLDARGLTMRKGFPESYDADALLAFLGDARRVNRDEGGA